jgi:hypothetical protein
MMINSLIDCETYVRARSGVGRDTLRALLGWSGLVTTVPSPDPQHCINHNLFMHTIQAAYGPTTIAS